MQGEITDIEVFREKYNLNIYSIVMVILVKLKIIHKWDGPDGSVG